MNRVTSWLKKYFIPDKGNDHQPHFLRQEAVTLVFLVIIVIELGFLAQVFIVFDKTKFLAAVLPGVLTTLANEDRAQNNIPPVTQNELLQRAAELKAKDMATHEYFAHTSPDGVTPWHWLDVVGYKYAMAGENLAVNFSDSGDVDQAWMNSPTHRANLLKDGFTEIGIGVASGVYEGRDTIFVAQFFGTPIKTSAPKPTAVTTVTPKPKATVTPTTPKVTPITASGGTPPKAVAPAPKKAPTQIVQNSNQVLGEENNSSSTATPKTTNQLTRLRSLIEEALTSPLQSINHIYEIIAFLIIFALGLSIFIKIKFQHPALILRGATLVAVIVFLFFVNMRVVNRVTQVPLDDLSASVIVAY